MELLDQIRDYWDKRPCNINHGQSPIGTKAYFDEVESRRYSVEPHNYSFACFDRWQNKRVLEIGCGIGTDAVNFVRHGADYTGVKHIKEPWFEVIPPELFRILEKAFGSHLLITAKVK